MKVDYRFKVLYALGMIMIVSGHVSQYGGLSLFTDWFPYYSFHLGLFVFASGYFYKNISENNVKYFICKKIKRLLLPLYVYNIFYSIFILFLHTKKFEIGNTISIDSLLFAPIMHGHQFMYNLGGWFVIPLFMVELYNVLIRKMLKQKVKNEWIYYLLSLLLGVIGNYLAFKGYHNDLWLVLVRFLHFIPFYTFGILYRKKLESVEKRISSRYYFSAIMIVTLIIIFKFKEVPTYTPAWMNDIKHPIAIYLIGYLGILFWVRVATLLESVVGKSKWVHSIANNSYAIMMNHFLGFFFVNLMFGLANKYLNLIEGFEWGRFRSSVFYSYMIKDSPQFLIIYVISGILTSIFIQKVVDKIKMMFSK